MLIVGARSMLIVGAAPFINGHTNYQHENVDSWCSTIYKRCMLIVGAQHIHYFCNASSHKDIGSSSKKLCNALF